MQTTARTEYHNARRMLRDFRAHLNGPKFGPQADGSRGDWIATADVLRRIETLLTILEN